MLVLCSYAHVYSFTCLHAWICVLPCFYAYIHMLICTFTCLHAYLRAYMNRSVYLHTLIDAFYMLYAISHVLVCFMPCLCAQAQTLSVMPCAIVALLCLGLMVRTRFRPYGLCHRPYTKAHIKEFGSFLLACLCLLVSMLYACVSLSRYRLCHALCPMQA